MKKKHNFQVPAISLHARKPLHSAFFCWNLPSVLNNIRGRRGTTTGCMTGCEPLRPGSGGLPMLTVWGVRSERAKRSSLAEAPRWIRGDEFKSKKYFEKLSLFFKGFNQLNILFFGYEDVYKSFKWLKAKSYSFSVSALHCKGTCSYHITLMCFSVVTISHRKLKTSTSKRTIIQIHDQKI